MKKEVSRGLEISFVIHFIADTLFALPLMIAPEPFLTLLGWQMVDPIAARLVGAALLGIGIESLLGRKGSPDSFKAMLNLKIIWSFSAIIGFITDLLLRVHDNPPAVYLFLGIFTAFNILWIYWRKQLGKGED
ncbi:MAG: hypothetical protein PQJ60_10145 [Spirochaetales bacterium]|nr:hypothetical protein [Spirochaetales bacterium]